MSSYLSKDREPLRRYVYGVGVAVLALLVGLGVITEDLSQVLDALLVAGLLIPAVEVARSKVTPAEEYVADNSFTDL